MDAGKQIYVLLICQGFYLGSVCQRWTFPEKLTARIGSCVEIPCTYDPPESLQASSTVWYLYDFFSHQEILNTKDASSVMRNYRDRTSLIPGNNSCALRIDPVTNDDGKKYYPGIAEDGKRVFDVFDFDFRTLQLEVTDKVNIQLFVPDLMTEGDATTLTCAVTHACRSSPPSLQWSKPGTVINKSVDLTGGYWVEESQLLYTPSYVDDGTSVGCTATYHRKQSTMTSRKLNIDYAPKNVTATVIGMDKVKEGGNVTIKCNSISKTKIEKYEWHKGKGKTKLMETEQTITVTSVTKDMGHYGCAVTNLVGRGESALVELPVPHATTEVHITAKYESEFTELTCAFLSIRPHVTHYTWMKDGSIVQNEEKTTLIIYNNEESYGHYVCIAYNSAGNFSSKGIHIKRSALGQGCTNCFQISTGTIIGIVICDALITLLIACMAFWIANKIQQKKYQESLKKLKNVPPANESPYEELHGQRMDIYNDLKSGRK